MFCLFECINDINFVNESHLFTPGKTKATTHTIRAREPSKYKTLIVKWIFSINTCTTKYIFTELQISYYRVDIYCITYSAVWPYSAVRIRPSGLDPNRIVWAHSLTTSQIKFPPHPTSILIIIFESSGALFTKHVKQIWGHLRLKTMRSYKYVLKRIRKYEFEFVFRRLPKIWLITPIILSNDTIRQRRCILLY